MKKVLKVMGLVAATILVSGVCYNTASAYDMNSRKEMKLEFNTDEKDIMNISDGYSNGSCFNCTWRKNNVNFNNGNVRLTIDKDNGEIPYSGAEYRTKDHFGFGMYETRMKPIKNDGVVSSFFTYTGPSEDTVWDEIDIEFLGKDTTKVQFNYYTNGEGGHEFLYDLGFDASESFHTYGFDWEKDYITWYVDLKPVYTAKKDIPQVPGQIMMNVWPGIGVDDWLKSFDGNGPLTAEYDYLSYKAASGSTIPIVIPGDNPSESEEKPSTGLAKDVEVTVDKAANVSNSVNNTFTINAKKEIDLSKLTIRYYFVKSDKEEMNFFCDNASVQLNRVPYYVCFNSNVSGKFGHDTNGNYVDINIADNFILKPEDGAVKIQARLANQNWSNLSNYRDGKVMVIYK